MEGGIKLEVAACTPLSSRWKPILGVSIPAMSNRGLHVASKVIKKDKRRREKPTEGVRFLKSRGQHILKSAAVLDAIVTKAGIKNTDVVLEIGPGTGNLTTRLLEKAKKVIAVEVDSRLVLELQRRVQHTEGEAKLQIMHDDVLKMDLPYFDLCVANIPYNISSPLIFKLLAHRPMFRSATILLQREFAMRMIASPGDSLFCRLALNTQLLARVSHLMKIGRNCFIPPPKVDSSLVRIEPRSPLPPINFVEWDGFTKICFSRKNKTLSAAFRQTKLLKSLEEIYKTYHALKLGREGEDLVSTFEKFALESKCAKDEASSDDSDGDELMEEENDFQSFKHRIIRVLEELDFSEKRPVKMSQSEFMLLLARFNSAEIHFVS